ncbi:MAG: outer membrane beta-barrel protein, partial [Gammaproteobacteria bacterium]
QLNVGYNLFPGEAFLSDDTVLNSLFFVKGGVGTTEFGGDDRFAFNFGFGYQLLFADSFNFSAEFRDLIFNIDLFGEDKSTHNLETILAIGWYF